MAGQDPAEEWDDLEVPARGAARGQCPVPLPWISLVDVDDEPTDELLDDHARNEKAVEDADADLKKAQEAEDAAKEEADRLQDALNDANNLPESDDKAQQVKEAEDALRDAQSDLEQKEGKRRDAQRSKIQAEQEFEKTKAKLEGRNMEQTGEDFRDEGADANLDDDSESEKDKKNTAARALKFLALLLLALRALWALENHNPGGCMTVDYDKIVPGGSLSANDMTMLAPIKEGFFSTSGTGGAGVSAPDACTGKVCSVCTMNRQVGDDKNHTETTVAITAKQVHDYYSNKPSLQVVCPTPIPFSPGTSIDGVSMADDPVWIGRHPNDNLIRGIYGLQDPLPGYANTGVTRDQCAGQWIQLKSSMPWVNSPRPTAVCLQSAPATGTPAPGAPTPTQGGGVMSNLDVYKTILKGTQNPAQGLDFRRLSLENHWACRNFQAGQYCTGLMQKNLCSQAKSCSECTDGGLANVCRWQQDATHAVENCNECPTQSSGTTPEPQCVPQEPIMNPAFLAPNVAYYHFMIPSLPMPFPTQTTYTPLGQSKTNPPSTLGPDSASLPPQTRAPVRSCSMEGRPYGWKLPNIYDINSAEACHSIGGQWLSPTSMSTGFGWGCVNQTMGNSTIMNQPGTKNNVVDYTQCTTDKNSWKPLYFHGCNDCSSLDMFGLNPSNPLGPITQAAGGIMKGIGDLGSWLDGIFGWLKYVLYAFILLCLLLSAWCMFSAAKGQGQKYGN